MHSRDLSDPGTVVTFRKLSYCPPHLPSCLPYPFKAQNRHFFPDGLANDYRIGSVLPSGVAKVSTVTSPSYPPCKPLVEAGGVGLVGKVDPKQDYACAPVTRVALALAHRSPDPGDTATKLFGSDDPESPFQIFDGAFVSAEKADGECVVVDYRNMPTYMINEGNQPFAQVAHCS